MAIFAARQFEGLPHTARRCARAAGWLSVAIVMLATLTPGSAAVTSYSDASAYHNALSWYEVSTNFESYPAGTVIEEQYASLGAHFSAGPYGGASPQVRDLAGLDGSQPLDAHALGAIQGLGGDPRSYGMRVTFDGGVKSIGGYHLDVGVTLYVALYDGAGALLPGSPFVVGGGGESGATARFFGCISDARNIKTVDFYTLAAFPGDFFALDNLQFTGPRTEAAVSVWDNWISFGALNPIAGTTATPVPVIASGAPAGDWPPTATIPGVGGYDVGYLEIAAPARLKLSVKMGGHLTHCAPDGTPFTGKDTRKPGTDPRYELKTQWKVALRGKFLTPGETVFESPTTGEETDFDQWTGWGGAEAGWLSPSAKDAWTGADIAGTTDLEMLVERDQFTGSETGGAAAICFIERILQRGQQDVAGNYRQVIDITLTYAE
ncbi:MAG: hypothetical protein ABFE07_15540 [Armatimonadia bacterium]